ncbi:MAG: Transcriptional regulator in cluster with Zn-dependent hydrolase [Anaerolineae bacterium]|nr:MAG: Transcriptional regulator in cluster with Zn-dependent hydrolase [Anaerolineae bacterium]
MGTATHLKLSRPEHLTLTEMTAATIGDAIRQGQYKPGSQLPSEAELINMLRVSRSTLREALRLLEEQGLIIRKRGLGTFVSTRSIVKDLSQNFGITEMISQAGLLPGTLNESIRLEKVDKTIAERLHLTAGDSVLVVERIRTANEVPIVWSIDYVPAMLLGDIDPDTLNFQQQSLYDFLYHKLNLRVVYGIAQLYPLSASRELAQKLHVRPRESLLLVEQTDYDDKNQPVIHSIEYHLPDKITFVIYRKGPHHYGIGS